MKEAEMVEEVADGIYRIPSVLGIRRFAQWLVVGEDVLLIDTGINSSITEHVLPALSELGIPPARVTQAVISHADVDHYGGNAEIRLHVIYASASAGIHDRRWLETWSTISAERYGWYRQHGIDYEPETMAWLQNAAGPDMPIDEDVCPGERIDLGGITVDIVGLPGHSPGHVGVFHEASRTAVIMDAVLGRGLYSTDDRLISPPPYSSVPDYRATVATLRRLDPERLGTSHYAPIEGRTAVAAFLDNTDSFVNDLDKSVLACLSDAPQPLKSIWRQADQDVGPFSEMNIELARSVGAHLEYAESRSLAERSEVAGRPAWRSCT